MNRKRKNRVTYSDLPKDLLEKISESLDTKTDLLRFRAVCKSWRSSATSSFKKSPSLNLKLPIPFDDDDTVPVEMEDGDHLVLTERIVYRLQSPKSSNPNSWVIKTETAGDGKLRLVNPLNAGQIEILPETPIPKVINTLNFRVSEVCRAYTLHYVKPSHPKYYDECPISKKVAVYFKPNSNDYIVMTIDYRNKLWYIKSGDENWTKMDKELEWACSFCDVMYYKGQFHVVDVGGAVWVLDSNFERTKITGYSSRDASKRQLVELYDGELYLVEGVTDKHKWYDDGPVFNTVVEVVISRMDRLKCEWVETKTVKDRVIFVGEDCSFALPSEEFRGCVRGRFFHTDAYIFFRIEEEVVYDFGYDDSHECDSSDEEDVPVRRDDFVLPPDVKSKFRGWHGDDIGVYDFKSGKIGSLMRFPEYAGVFWPPPRWLK